MIFLLIPGYIKQEKKNIIAEIKLKEKHKKLSLFLHLSFKFECMFPVADQLEKIFFSILKI